MNLESAAAGQLNGNRKVIYNNEFDSRNFRKKILQSGFLEKTSKKDKSSSRKGAYLYRFIDSDSINKSKTKDTNIKDVFQF